MALGDYTLNSDTVANNKYSITSGTFYDEDILNLVPALPDNGPYNVFYRTGASGNWTWSKTQAYPYLINANSIRYNQFTGGSWQLTDITTTNRWVNYYVFATNAITPGFEYIIIPGQAIYTTLALAQGESVSNLSFGNLPFAEIVPVARVTHQFSTSYVNANGRARIVAVASLTATSFVSAIATASNHNSLSGLQGGVAGEYYHLTSAQYNDFIGSTEVASISGDLQAQIDAISGGSGSVDLSAYTLLSTTASISAALEQDIANLDLDLQSQIMDIGISNSSVSSISGTSVTIDSFPHYDDVGLVEWLVSISNGTNIRASRLLVSYGNLAVASNEDYVTSSGDTSDAALTATIDATNVYLKLTSVNNWNIKTKRIII
jgi:hypothetical protein